MGTALAVRAQMYGTTQITGLCCTLATCLTLQQVGWGLSSALPQVVACMAQPSCQSMQEVNEQSPPFTRGGLPQDLQRPQKWAPILLALSMKLAVVQTCRMCCTMGCCMGWRRRAGSLTSTGTRSSMRLCARPGRPRLKGGTPRRASSPSLPGPQPSPARWSCACAHLLTPKLLHLLSF